MYMREPKEETPVAAIPFSMQAAVALSAIATLYLGIWPNYVVDFAQRGAITLIH
jgi:NADH:ubiquinone oxidoreductase subunit 2 (subunit N)